MYREQQVQPLGVNPASVTSHERYAAKFAFPFALLSDPDRTAARDYGALKPDGTGIQRSVVLITRDGTVAGANERDFALSETLAPLDA